MNKKYNKLKLPVKGVMMLILIALAYAASAFITAANTASSSLHPAEDSLLSKKAFAEVYKVLLSPRCMNCHPAGDVPLQGDDSHAHTQNVKRGKDGKGLYAMKCANCHQPGNTPGLNMPPGNAVWQLPPADMKMVFQGRSPRELAAQLLNPETNGHKTREQLIQHVAEDGLVLWGWNPGEGRTLPPLSHEAFVQQFRQWIDNGAYLP